LNGAGGGAESFESTEDRRYNVDKGAERDVRVRPGATGSRSSEEELLSATNDR
jgi:hypothetical protein